MNTFELREEAVKCLYRDGRRVAAFFSQDGHQLLHILEEVGEKTVEELFNSVKVSNEI